MICKSRKSILNLRRAGMDKLLEIIDSKDCDVATSEKDRFGRHQKVDKDAMKANLKSKQQMQNIAEKLAVNSLRET